MLPAPNLLKKGENICYANTSAQARHAQLDTKNMKH